MAGIEAAAEAGRAMMYAGIGAAALKAAEFLLKTFGVRRNLQAVELEQTLGAAALIREELRRDNRELRDRMRESDLRMEELEDRLEKVEKQYQTVRDMNDILRTENDELRTRLRSHERVK